MDQHNHTTKDISIDSSVILELIDPKPSSSGTHIPFLPLFSLSSLSLSILFPPPFTMNVYCQRTNLNERLCSLLSAVWMRSIRPSHTSAIVHKGRIIIKSQDNGHLQPLGIILVGKQTQIPFHLASLTKMFGRQYSLEVTTVFTLKESAKTSTTTTTMAAYKQLE